MTFYSENRTLIFVGITIIGLIIGFCVYWFYFKSTDISLALPSAMKKEVRFEQEAVIPQKIYFPKGTVPVSSKQIKPLPRIKPSMPQQSQDGRIAPHDAARRYQEETTSQEGEETDDELSSFFAKGLGENVEYQKEE